MLIALSLLGLARAGEGMWLPEQVPSLAAELRAAGFTVPPSVLADPNGPLLGAILSTGGCTASFVSADGLVITNHHCVAEYTQYASDAGHDLAHDGYLAPDRAGERSGGPSARLYIVEAMTDVSATVLKGVRAKTPDLERRDRVDKARKRLVASCEEGGSLRCAVVGFYGGGTFRLIRSRELRDVRLVYAPAESVGSYGGEIDNWMWPRHAGDFALLRAYVGPDGRPAAPAKENVPYRPPAHLQIDPTGAQEGEPVFCLGYPGRTNRYGSAAALRFERDVVVPRELRQSTDWLAILHEESARSTEAAARLAAPIDWIGNADKNNRGLIDGLRRGGVLEAKEERERRLAAWLAADPRRAATYGSAVRELGEVEAAARSDTLVNSSIRSIVRSSDLASTAYEAWRFATEREKPDLERARGFQDRDLADALDASAQLEHTLWLPAERRLLEHGLRAAEAAPEPARLVPLHEWLRRMGGVDAALAALYTDPPLRSSEARAALFKASKKELIASKDPWVQLAIALDRDAAPRREQDKVREGALLRLRPVVLEALQAAAPGLVYPDANSTLRLSFGRVEGMSPRDGMWYRPHTTVQGMAVRAGEAPFNAPAALLAAAPTAPASRWADPLLKDVVVDFLSTLDTTGGNSGSPTLNAEGKLVGLVFDGNYEAITADEVFEDPLTRSIHVDVRYLLWTLDQEPRAAWILDELGLAAPARPTP
jgi:hypothetical protein